MRAPAAGVCLAPGLKRHPPLPPPLLPRSELRDRRLTLRHKPELTLARKPPSGADGRRLPLLAWRPTAQWMECPWYPASGYCVNCVHRALWALVRCQCMPSAEPMCGPL